MSENEWTQDEWKSLTPGYPYLYAGAYQVVKEHENGVTFELYVQDKNMLGKVAGRLKDYAKMYSLYSQLYGDPGYSVFRIVGSSVSGVGASFNTGFMTMTDRLMDRHHVSHEMAHTWWGGLVSATGSGNKFLSEAMAEFSARWILQVLNEPHEYENLSKENILGWKQRQYCTYFPVTKSANCLLAPLTFQEGADSRMVTGRNYHWGPLVINQIRMILGDDVFFNCLKTFITKYKGKQVDIDDFIQTINSVSGKDMTSELKGMLCTTGFASYQVLGFDSKQVGNQYQSAVRIRNDGEYGFPCPLLLQTVGGKKRKMVEVVGHQEKEFFFTTNYRVVDVVVDPDSTNLLQYSPDQKLRLWQSMLKEMDVYWNNEAFGKSYMCYALGDFKQSIEPISNYLADSMKRDQVTNIDDLLKKDNYLGAYVFMRGIFFLASKDSQKAEGDIRSVFPYMIKALEHENSVQVPSSYYETGAIQEKDLQEYLDLLSLVSGRELSFPKNLDEQGRRKKVEEWSQWWEKDGKDQKLNLVLLNEHFERNRKEFRKSLHLLN